MTYNNYLEFVADTLEFYINLRNSLLDGDLQRPIRMDASQVTNANPEGQARRDAASPAKEKEL